MDISETAQKNYHVLFPGHVSTRRVTDPELVDMFSNFAFDEILAHAELDARLRPMVRLASRIGAQALGEYRVMLGAALEVGVPPVEVIPEPAAGGPGGDRWDPAGARS